MLIYKWADIWIQMILVVFTTNLTLSQNNLFNDVTISLTGWQGMSCLVHY